MQTMLGAAACGWAGLRGGAFLPRGLSSHRPLEPALLDRGRDPEMDLRVLSRLELRTDVTFATFPYLGQSTGQTYIPGAISEPTCKGIARG